MSTWSPVAVLMAFALVAGPEARIQPPKPLDFEVKAAYLLSFGRFATWPTAAAVERERFDVCVIGRDPFGSALDQTVAGETIDGRDVVARRIPNAQDATACRILYVSSSEDNRLPTILPVAQKAAVLTVSDIPHFTDRGGMIQFISQDRRVRFQVNTAAVHDAGLALSSELLRVATAVVKSVP